MTSGSGRLSAVRTATQAAVIVTWCLLPFGWMVVTAFRPVDQTYETSLWPRTVTWENFRTALSTELGNHLGQAIANSLIVGVTVTVVSLVFGASAAYAIARLEFRG